MKKIYLLSLLFFSLFSNAQSGITYQAVLLNPKGKELPGVDNSRAPLVNKNICLRFKISKGTSLLEYQETLTTTTDEFGMVNVIIGTGTKTGGSATNFASINWDGNPKNLMVELDITANCSNFLEISNQPFTSVPFALYAANSGTAGITGPAGPQGIQGLKGDTGLQGIQGIQGVKGDTGAQGIQGVAGTQGLIGLTGPQGLAGANEQGGVTISGTGISVSGSGTIANPYVVSTSHFYSIGLSPELGGYIFWVSADGKHGLVAETQNQGSTSWYNAQNLISDPSNHSIYGKNFRDWRMPTIYELNEMQLSKDVIGNFTNGYYHSSTEESNSIDLIMEIFNGSTSNASKGTIYKIRSVRSF